MKKCNYEPESLAHATPGCASIKLLAPPGELGEPETTPLSLWRLLVSSASHLASEGGRETLGHQPELRSPLLSAPVVAKIFSLGICWRGLGSLCASFAFDVSRGGVSSVTEF